MEIPSNPEDPLPASRPLLIFNHNPKAGGGSIEMVFDDIKNDCSILIRARRKQWHWDLVEEKARKKAESDASFSWNEKDCYLNIFDTSGTTYEHRKHGFVIGNVREPCSHYLSLWSYGSSGRGGFKNVAKQFHGKDAPFYNSTADIQRFENWVHHRSIFGVLRGRFVQDSYGIDMAGVDCMVFVEFFQYSLARCLRLYEQQGGHVRWELPEMVELLEIADAQKQDILSEVRARRSGDVGVGDGGEEPSRALYVSKDNPLDNPQTMHHAPCETYFNDDLARVVEDGPERLIYELFGYGGCRRKDLLDYSLVFDSKDLDLDNLAENMDLVEDAGSKTPIGEVVSLLLLFTLLATGCRLIKLGRNNRDSTWVGGGSGQTKGGDRNFEHAAGGAIRDDETTGDENDKYYVDNENDESESNDMEPLLP